MIQWLHDFWNELKPQNNNEVGFRVIGVLSLMIAILVAKGIIVLNTFGQVVWIIMVASACLVCTSNRNNK